MTLVRNTMSHRGILPTSNPQISKENTWCIYNQRTQRSTTSQMLYTAHRRSLENFQLLSAMMSMSRQEKTIYFIITGLCCGCYCMSHDLIWFINRICVKSSCSGPNPFMDQIQLGERVYMNQGFALAARASVHCLTVPSCFLCLMLLKKYGHCHLSPPTHLL